jgi:uncharacterized protein YndB with AHSA1/START domain
MAQFKTGLVIRRPREDVFAFVANYQNSPRWVSGELKHTKVSDGPIGVGTVIRTTGRTLGLRIEATRIVTAYKPSSMYAFKSEYQRMPITTTFLFEPIDDGTRLTVVVDGEPTGLFKATAPIVLGAIRQQFEGDLRRLKTVLETPEPLTNRISTQEP